MDFEVLPSPDGTDVLSSFLHFEPVEHFAFWIQGAHPSEKAIDVPEWFRQAEGGADVAPEEVQHLFAWLDPGHLYVHQGHRVMQFEDQCGIWDIAAAAWVEKPHCIHGDFHLLWRIQPGPGGKLAVYSAGEGHPGVRLVRYDLEKGQSDLGAPELDLYPAGPLEAHFTAGEEILLATPCLLEQHTDRPCEPVMEDESLPWKLFSWEPGQKGFRLVRDSIPEYAVPHPSEPGKMAWGNPSSVCIGDPAKKAEARCFSIENLP